MGVPRFQLAGLGDSSARESRERVRSAIIRSGFELPGRVVAVTLAPAELEKQGSHLDLGIAVALLASLAELPDNALEGRMICGEIGFEGTMRPIPSALAIAELATREGYRELIFPAANAAEAAAAGGVSVVPVRSLPDTVEHLVGRCRLAPALAVEQAAEPVRAALDLSDVRGCEPAKRALEVAAAGGHPLLMIGPLGSGRTMLARRLPGLLPPLEGAESIAVTKVHSLVAEEPPIGLAARRPFRSPHPGVSIAGLIGGGSMRRPGEVSLAHGGVLFLDGLAEFRREALEALRQPLEQGKVTVVRSRARFNFPARFALVAAMGACPCGHLGNPRCECRCPQRLIERCRSRVSRSLKVIDMSVEVPALSPQDLEAPPGEASAEVARRVLNAREIQRRRFGDACSTPINAAMSTESLDPFCHLEPAAQSLLDGALGRQELSVRAVDRILRVAYQNRL